MDEKKPVPMIAVMLAVVAVVVFIGAMAYKNFGGGVAPDSAPAADVGKVPNIGTGSGAEKAMVDANPNFYPSAPAGSVPGAPPGVAGSPPVGGATPR
jgi:hypothetical protein